MYKSMYVSYLYGNKHVEQIVIVSTQFIALTVRKQIAGKWQTLSEPTNTNTAGKNKIARELVSVRRDIRI